MAVGADYMDQSATVADQGNPSYAGTITANPATVDTSSSGNKTITYTAPPDAAGNIPDSIIRIVAVEDAPPIDISLFTITSNNNNTSYAKAGDTLSIQSSINYTIASYTATIFGIEQFESNQNSNGFLISQQVPSNLTIEEYATFSITIIDEKGLPNTITQNTNITSSQLPPDNVFVDTISPTVTLSPQEPTISVNQMLPTITADIVEGDPNYNYSDTSPIPESTILASVDNTTAEVYPFTYTAPPDTAGNLGQSVTINVTSLRITSNSGNNFANAGKIITLSLETDSNDLDNFTGTLLGKPLSTISNGGSATFTTTVLSNDTNGNVTFSIEALNSSDGRVAISESDLDAGSFVTIDTVVPVIKLNGENNTIVAVGADYMDQSATVADQGNPSYAGTITANPATVDTSSSGNKTITYTAPPDAAGNIPDSIIRIVARV